MMEGFRERLDIIEREVRRIADSLDLLVRLDERMLSYQTKQEDHETRIRALEGSGVSWTVGVWSKVWWIVAAAVAGFGFNIAQDAITHPATPALQSGTYPPNPEHSVH